MKIYVARHGETTWNVRKRILGNTPGELTEKGKAQAKELANHLAGVNLTRIYSSDLHRAAETSQIVCVACPQVELIFSPELRERNFGELEGKLMAEVDWDGFWSLPSSESRYGAESLDAFTARIARFITTLNDGAQGQVIGIICHIGVMNRLNYLTDPENFHFINYPNADATEFDLDLLTRNCLRFLDTK